MNIKTRLKNKTFMITMLVAVVAFVYQILGICGVTAPISQDDVTNFVMLAINMLAGLGILVDPTTSGITDGEKSDE